MKASASGTCLSSSRVMIRTTTFVSAARMFVAYVIRDRFVHLFDRASFWPRGKKSAMNVFRRVLASLANDDVVAMVMPLKYGAWNDAELLSDRGGNGDLSLGGDFRL